MITYIEGDVLEAKWDLMKVVPHVCNDACGWGAGFVLSLSKKWKEPEDAYRSLEKYVLGTVQFVQVHPRIFVANMIAQSGYHRDGNPIPLDYIALEKCMDVVDAWVRSAPMPTVITAPRFGAGLAGGDWGVIEDMIAILWGGLCVEIYDL